ncbi:hypothetical protein PflQ2_1993 [Pseudomonas fluorescens Q2-87]|uniref:Uncharacterized protein n=1 Tax=Pseudomonas fluorescens (strain Q2-87) TaxID=1038922 RepID=J2Y4D5_PSEFQ|nr:hypothetical protein PflQ2_1993 [Pseudomonas fluorescens Q2-87]
MSSVAGLRIILEAGCADQLPEPLIGRFYLDLQPLHQLDIDIGTAVMEVAEGRTPAQVQSGIDARLAAFKLRERALKYFQARPVEVWGNGRNHEVAVYREGTSPSLLQPAPWMWESNEWNYMLNDDCPTFCPTKGRWHWELSSSSSEMRPLATAVLSVSSPLQGSYQSEPFAVPEAGTAAADQDADGGQCEECHGCGL